MNFQANVNFVCTPRWLMEFSWTVRQVFPEGCLYASTVLGQCCNSCWDVWGLWNQNDVYSLKPPYWENNTTYIGFNLTIFSPYERTFGAFFLSFSSLLHTECYEIISIMKVSAQKLRIEGNILHILPIYLSKEK